MAEALSTMLIGAVVSRLGTLWTRRAGASLCTVAGASHDTVGTRDRGPGNSQTRDVPYKDQHRLHAVVS